MDGKCSRINMSYTYNFQRRQTGDRQTTGHGQLALLTSRLEVAIGVCRLQLTVKGKMQLL